MTVMPNFTQFVSLVAKGGSPITLADAFGNPYPTTGHGSLVFNEGATLTDVAFDGILNALNGIKVPPGSAVLPSVAVGIESVNNTGLFSPAPEILGLTAGGVAVMTMDSTGITITGNVTYSGNVIGPYHDPLTTRGDLYYFGPSGSTRLPLGLAGNVLASNGTDLIFAPPAAGGTVTAISGVVGETVATPDPVIASGTVGLADTAVVPGSYGDSTHIPQILIDQKGRITTAGNIPVTVGGTVTSVGAGTGLAATPSPIVGAGIIRLADTTVVPATYGSATNIPQIVVDQQGRITSASNVVVSIPPAGVTSISQGTGITLTPNPLVATGSIAVNTTVIATKNDLNNYLLLAGGTVTGTVVYQPSGPLAASVPAIDIRQTWNNAAVDFVGMAMNITNTASGGGARLVSLQVGGADRFYVDKFGTTVINGNTYSGGSAHANTGTGIPPGGTLDSGYMFSSASNFGLTFGSGVPNKAFAKGTIYARSDGNGMPYTNIDGTATGWVRQAGITVSDTAPTVATPDQLFWNSTLGTLFIRYDDGNSVAWVPAAPSATWQQVVARGYIDGFQHTIAGGNQSYTVGAGMATDSTNAVTISRTSAMTKTLAAWSAGNGGGSLDTGTIGTNWYHSFEILNPTTGVVDHLISLSATAPVLPSGFTYFRRHWAMVTDGSFNLIGLIQYGDRAMYKTSINHGQMVPPAPIAVPTQVTVLAHLGAYIVGTGGNIATLTFSTAGSGSNTSVQASVGSQGSGTINGLGSMPVDVPVANQSLSFVGGGGLSAYNILVYGWTDRRGKDA